jgi:hypothetical protein
MTLSRHPAPIKEPLRKTAQCANSSGLRRETPRGDSPVQNSMIGRCMVARRHVVKCQASLTKRSHKYRNDDALPGDARIPLPKSSLPSSDEGMRTLRSILALFAVCVLSLSTAVGMPDNPKTSYDESEPLSYACAPQPLGDLFEMERRAVESLAIPDFKTLIGARLNSPIRRERAGGIACSSLVILVRSLRC